MRSPITKSWSPKASIFSVAAGCACHSDPKGTPHAGGRAFPIPFGTVYSTNLTADKETGLGGWTDQQIADAVTKGVLATGENLAAHALRSVFRYGAGRSQGIDRVLAHAKAGAKGDAGVADIGSHVRSIAAEGWLKAFGQFFTPPATAPKSGIERGKYLTEHVAICGDCHTPRSSIGVPNRSMYMAGAGKDIGPLGELVPNITPDKETGIGAWKREEIADLLIPARSLTWITCAGSCTMRFRALRMAIEI